VSPVAIFTVTLPVELEAKASAPIERVLESFRSAASFWVSVEKK